MWGNSVTWNLLWWLCFAVLCYHLYGYCLKHMMFMYSFLPLFQFVVMFSHLQQFNWHVFLHEHLPHLYIQQDITCSYPHDRMLDCARPCRLVCTDRSYSHTKSHFITCRLVCTDRSYSHIKKSLHHHSFLFTMLLQIILFYFHPIPLWFLAASHQAKLSLCFLKCSQ